MTNTIHADVRAGRAVYHLHRGKLWRGVGPTHCPHFIHCENRWWGYGTFPAGPPLSKESGMPIAPRDQKTRHDSPAGWPPWLLPDKERVNAGC